MHPFGAAMAAWTFDHFKHPFSKRSTRRREREILWLITAVRPARLITPTMRPISNYSGCAYQAPAGLMR